MFKRGDILEFSQRVEQWPASWEDGLGDLCICVQDEAKGKFFGRWAGTKLDANQNVPFTAKYFRKVGEIELPPVEPTL